MKTTIDITKDHIRLGDAGTVLARSAGILGGSALLAAILLGLLDPEAFLRGYLVNYAFFVSLALGALFFVLLQHVTRAGWSVVVRRLAENVTAAFPVLAVLSLPLLIPLLLGFDAIHHVYPWTDPEVVAHNEILRGKQGYLNVPFFVVRMVGYFVIWLVLAHYFYNGSVRQDETGDPALTTRMQSRSAPGMVLFALTTTFFAFDLLMTLDPLWFSTIFGVYYFSGAAVGFFAVLALMMVLLQDAGRMVHAISTDHFHDVGKLVFAFVVFWAYIAFSQYMLIWYGNIPEETVWYIVRQEGPWLSLSLILLFGHFIAPFLALISRVPKRRKNLLAIGAGWVLVMHWFDMVYLVMPHVAPGGEHAANLGVLETLQSLICLIGIGGLVVWAVVTRMSRAALLPMRDPRLTESLEFENI